jgi:hypothetical protein
MSVTIINVHGRSAEISVEDSWSVDRLKKEYSQYYGNNTWHGWYMQYGGKLLQAGDLLSDHNIKHGSIIHVQCRKNVNHISQPVELYVNDDEKPQLTLLVVDADWTVGRIMKEYAQLKGNESWNYRLSYRGVNLRERRVLGDYQIRDEAVLYSSIASVPSTQAGLRSLKRCISKRSCKFL